MQLNSRGECFLHESAVVLIDLSSCWIFYTAPFVGALLATGLYKILKWSRYETAVEGQDGDNRHMLIRTKEGELAGFVQEVDEQTAQPHMDNVIEREISRGTGQTGMIPGTPETLGGENGSMVGKGPAGFEGFQVRNHVEEKGEPLGQPVAVDGAASLQRQQTR